MLITNINRKLNYLLTIAAWMLAIVKCAISKVGESSNAIVATANASS